MRPGHSRKRQSYRSASNQRSGDPPFRESPAEAVGAANLEIGREQPIEEPRGPGFRSGSTATHGCEYRVPADLVEYDAIRQIGREDRRIGLHRRLHDILVETERAG
jgi:hypothetical protein